MSFHRIRRLAGLNESFTNDEDLNAQIETRVATIAEQSHIRQNAWMDVLELIYHANRNGMSRDDIKRNIEAMYGDSMVTEFGPDGVDKILNVIGRVFGDLVETNAARTHFVWTKLGAANDLTDAEIDPGVQQAVGMQVQLSSETMEAMRQLTRQHGSFSEIELAQHLHRQSGLPLPIAAQFSTHMVHQFQSMLRREGDRYALIEEPPSTRDDTMEFLRGLAKNPKLDEPDEV